jgi:hypothetical protein
MSHLAQPPLTFLTEKLAWVVWKSFSKISIWCVTCFEGLSRNGSGILSKLMSLHQKSKSGKRLAVLVLDWIVPAHSCLTLPQGYCDGCYYRSCPLVRCKRPRCCSYSIWRRRSGRHPTCKLWQVEENSLQVSRKVTVERTRGRWTAGRLCEAQICF